MSGKKIRLSKLINMENKRICITPMDHGVTLGPVQGLNFMRDIVEGIVKGGTDGIVVHKGIFSSLCEHSSAVLSCNMILHLSASTNLSPDPCCKTLVSTVEQAVKMGAAGVSVHVNIGSQNECSMISDLGKVSDECMEWGMPLLAMMYVSNGATVSRNAGQIAHVARIAEEIGADMVKVSCPEKVADIRKIAEGVNIPVIISGGGKMPLDLLLKTVDESIKCGGSGVAIGRNIFQAPKPEKVSRLVYRLVHGRITLDEALYEAKRDNLYEGDLL